MRRIPNVLTSPSETIKTFASLMAESKNLSMQNEATSETISKAEKQSQHECGKTTCCSFANAMISRRTEFLVGRAGKSVEVEEPVMK